MLKKQQLGEHENKGRRKEKKQNTTLVIGPPRVTSIGILVNFLYAISVVTRYFLTLYFQPRDLAR